MVLSRNAISGDIIPPFGGGGGLVGRHRRDGRAESAEQDVPVPSPQAAIRAIGG
jgi:hypothetical protein